MEGYSMNRFIKGGGCGLAAILLFAGSALHANEASTKATQQAAMASHGFSEQTLDAFAAAYVKVADVYNTFAAKIESAQNAEQAYQVQVAINDETSQVIQEQGLSPEVYNRVVRAINEDPKLARTVAQKIRTLQQ
jgi:hypothetical protein